MRIRHFQAPRCFDAPDDYEDAAWTPAEELTLPLRVAVADGATTSSFSGLWARLLVEAWAAGRLPDEIDVPARRWQGSVAEKPLPWFARDKARLGAHAALVGLEIAEGGTWSALGAGDCCLFQVRRDVLIHAFPATHPSELHDRPLLVPSLGAVDAQLWRRAAGEWEPGDAFYLMSDALAHWFLAGAVVRERAPWRWLCGLGTGQEARAFSALVRQLREEGSLRPDDVTLVVVDL